MPMGSSPWASPLGRGAEDPSDYQDGLGSAKGDIDVCLLDPGDSLFMFLLCSLSNHLGPFDNR